MKSLLQVMATTYNELPLLLEYVGPNATQLNKLEKFTIFSFEDLGTLKTTPIICSKQLLPRQRNSFHCNPKYPFN